MSAGDANIDGYVDSRFNAVKNAFRENFARRGELGAAVTVIADGRTVVDLWGGTADHRSGRPWLRDTLALVFSATKGATALCAHMLASRGQLDLDLPVARYWPEFAAAGKEHLPVRMLLNHRAGLPAIIEPLPPDAIFDWQAMTTALAAQAPSWPPGSRHGYHAMTFGVLVGEVIRRVSGMSVGQFLRAEVAEPLGLDFWIGLPEHLEARVARLRLAPYTQQQSTPFVKVMMARESLTAKAFLNPRGLMMPGQANSRAVHAAEIPAANGIGTARALAGMYAPLACGGRLGGVELVDAPTLAAMGGLESDGPDAILLLPTRFASGFMKSVDNRPESSAILGPNAEAFGHPGAGGSIGMADPIARVAIGYVMNQLGAGVLLNERGQALIDSVYEALGA
jgi:CubicO group peptidase (beta-lactamase class C family)